MALCAGSGVGRYRQFRGGACRCSAGARAEVGRGRRGPSRSCAETIHVEGRRRRIRAVPADTHAAIERVGAVVIGRNEGARLVACLASVRAEVGTVVYVDSGSTDGSVERAKEAGAIALPLEKGPF